MPSAHLVGRFRASILFLPALVARYGHARIPFPGGCDIGYRPITSHLRTLQELGANVKLSNRFIEASGSLRSGRAISIQGDFGVSVTATSGAMIAAANTPGTTKLMNCAIEPEVVGLSKMLIGMGAEISGAGTPEITILGKRELNGGTFSVSPDRIEAGTWLIFGALLGNGVRLENTPTDELSSLIHYLRTSGATISAQQNSVYVSRTHNSSLAPLHLSPFPAIPTDLHAQLSVLVAGTNSRARIRDDVFPDRLEKTKAELAKLGVAVCSRGVSSSGDGQASSSLSTVNANDCRVASALVLAALLKSKGRVAIRTSSNLDRGYENFDAKLRSIGGKVSRIRA